MPYDTARKVDGTRIQKPQHVRKYHQHVRKYHQQTQTTVQPQPNTPHLHVRVCTTVIFFNKTKTKTRR